MGTRTKKVGYMISSVAETYQIHPQTLRLYERMGLLKPSRSHGNTRLYSNEDLTRLETILNLTRDLGVNLAGVEVILNMREKMAKMQRDLRDMIAYVRENLPEGTDRSGALRHALVRVPASKIVRSRMQKNESTRILAAVFMFGGVSVPQESVPLYYQEYTILIRQALAGGGAGNGTSRFRWKPGRILQERNVPHGRSRNQEDVIRNHNGAVQERPSA